MMDAKTLAALFYEDAVVFADKYQAPRSAVAEAQFRSAMQIFLDSDGPETLAAWLESEAAQFREATDNYRDLFTTAGHA